MGVTFSIVMAAYDRAHTLPRALASVRAQTRDDWEVIVVDDGSRDGTEKLVRDLEAADPRVRYVKHPVNRGVTAAKNTGFDHVRGDWIMTLDSDDEMVPQALAIFGRTLIDVAPDLDAVACNCFDSRTGRFTGRGLAHDQLVVFGEGHVAGEGFAPHGGAFGRGDDDGLSALKDGCCAVARS